MIGSHRNEGAFQMRRDEKPTRRVSKTNGDVRWVARYTNSAGARVSAGTYAKKGPCKTMRADGECCAQHRIWWAYENDKPVDAKPLTVGEYATDRWLHRHPRSPRTERSYKSRIRKALEMSTEDGPLGDLVLANVRIRHMDDLIGVMFSEGRTPDGTRNVLNTLSSMFKDAIRDELAESNPTNYVTVRDNDPRVINGPRERVVVPWRDMHAFAAAAGEYAPMIRVLSDCGLRLGEMLALNCKHVRDDVLVVEQKAWDQTVVPGTKSGRGREVPLSPEMAALLTRVKFGRIGLLFPNPAGKVWGPSVFYRRIWYPAQQASGLSLLPHDMRHSYVSLLRAAGVDPADLAAITGHTVQTATAKYTHSMGGTLDLVRAVAGQ